MGMLKEGSVIWNPVTKEIISKIATEEYVDNKFLLEKKIVYQISSSEPSDDVEIWYKEL